MMTGKTATTWEWCNHCGKESEIPTDGITRCPSCHNWLVPCTSCECPSGCGDCSRSKQAAELNDSDGANSIISPGATTSDSSDPGKPFTGEEDFCVKDLPGLFLGQHSTMAWCNPSAGVNYERYVKKLSLHIEVLGVVLEDLKLLDERVVSTPRLDRAIAALERALGVV